MSAYESSSHRFLKTHTNLSRKVKEAQDKKKKKKRIEKSIGLKEIEHAFEHVAAVHLIDLMRFSARTN